MTNPYVEEISEKKASLDVHWTLFSLYQLLNHDHHQGAGGMKKGFHVDVVQEHLEKEAEVGFQFRLISIQSLRKEIVGEFSIFPETQQ